jgi:hypothetical protein
MTWLERLNPQRTWPGFLGAAGVGLTALFVFMEPSPTDVLGLPALIVFWALHVFATLALAQGCQVVISRHLAPRENPWVSIVAAGLAASTLVTPLALGLDHLMVAPLDPAEGGAWTLAEIGEEWTALAPPVTLVWLGLNAVRFLRLSPDDPPASTPSVPGSDQPDFMRRLPVARRGQLIALSAELHYLRVHTTLGDALILQGFGEALAQLGPGVGLRVHRSHWIDPRFVVGVTRDGGRMKVELVNGVALPVARSRRGEVTAVLTGEAAPALG